MDNKVVKHSTLPKIADLYANIELAAQQNELNKLLNCEPKQEWLKQHPMAKNVVYLPIGVIEYLLTSIFIKWRTEIKGVNVIANSVQVTIRLHVQDPISMEWDWQDGIGAAPIHTEKGAGATDFTKVLTDSVMKAAPAAESYAIKDAAEKFGKIFGKDLNRKDQINYEGMMNGKFAPKTSADLPEELIIIIKNTFDKDKLLEIYKSNPEYHSNPTFMKLLNQQKQHGTANV